MIKSIRTMALSGSFLALASISSYADVSLSVDSTTTLTTTSWSGSPALGLNPPNGGSSIDGSLTTSVVFQPTSTFTLGSFEFYAGNGGTGANSIGSYSLYLYDLGPSFTFPSGSGAIYTFTGSEADLFSSGLSFTTTADNQFDVLSFSGADQISLTAGDTYILAITATSGQNMDIERGSSTTGSGNANFATQWLGLSSAAPGSGVAVNQVGAGHRDAVGAFYAAAVPEPSVFAFAGFGIAVLGAVRRFKK